MRVIIPAAGRSRRFVDEGYRIPKPFITIRWRGLEATMLEHVLHTIPAQYENITVGILADHWKQEYIQRIDPPIQMLTIEKTIGPADTVSQLLEYVDTSILIIDVDVLNHTNDLYGLTKLVYPAVLVSKSANPSFSYVDHLGRFQTIREKERISDYAVRGAYYIPHSLLEEFKDILYDTLHNIEEPYISDAVQHIAYDKVSILTTYKPIEWGTPEDVRLSGAIIVTEKGEEDESNRSNQRS